MEELENLPSEDIAAIGVYTNSDGPYFDDYFLLIVLKNDTYITIPSEHTEFYSCIKVLEKKLNFEMKYYLLHSTVLDSAIVWPEYLAERKLINFVPRKDNIIERILLKLGISIRYNHEVTDEVRALLD